MCNLLEDIMRNNSVKMIKFEPVVQEMSFKEKRLTDNAPPQAANLFVIPSRDKILHDLFR